jgi:hypothetical protein
VHGGYYSVAPVFCGGQPYEEATLANVNVVNSTALRLQQSVIDRIRTIARRKSETSERDIAWPVIGRELVERALLEEERRARPELPLA